MTPRGRRTAMAAGVSAVVLAAVAVGAVLAWPPDQLSKQMTAEPEPVADSRDQDEVDPHTYADAESAAMIEPGLMSRIALVDAQQRTVALADEVARLRWKALSERRDCVTPPPPPPPPVAEAEPEPEPPVEPPEPEPEPIVVAEAPPPPMLTPVRERPPAPPPPPPEPEPVVVAPVPVPQVALVEPTPPPPPQPVTPPPPPGNTEFDNRIRREGGRQTEQLVTLIWNNTNDLDLHVLCPNGTRVYFANISGCGSQLDIDMNASTNRLSRAPVENIVWPSGLPTGRYQVFVDHYANHGSPDPTPYRVRVRVLGDERTFNGSIRHGESARFVTEFFVN